MRTTDRHPPAVLIEDLLFRYAAKGPRRFQLEVPRFEIEAGASVVVQGPSGSGKSTLLRLVGGLLRPERGRIEVFGDEVTQRSASRGGVGFVFQDYPLVASLDCLQNVLLPLRLASSAVVDDRARTRAAELLGRLDLPDVASSRPASLSQGERQRVAIARALITEPRLLLADEPTTGLDPERSRRLIDLLERLVQEHSLTLLTVSHDPTLAERFEATVPLSEIASAAGHSR